MSGPVPRPPLHPVTGPSPPRAGGRLGGTPTQKMPEEEPGKKPPGVQVGVKVFFCGVLFLHFSILVNLHFSFFFCGFFFRRFFRRPMLVPPPPPAVYLGSKVAIFRKSYLGRPWRDPKLITPGGCACRGPSLLLGEVMRL